MVSNDIDGSPIVILSHAESRLLLDFILLHTSEENTLKTIINKLQRVVNPHKCCGNCRK